MWDYRIPPKHPRLLALVAWPFDANSIVSRYPVPNYAYRVSGGQAGKDVALSAVDFDAYFKSVKLKNGFVMTILEFDTMNGQIRDLKAQCQALIASIDKEMRPRIDRRILGIHACSRRRRPDRRSHSCGCSFNPD